MVMTAERPSLDEEFTAQLAAHFDIRTHNGKITVENTATGNHRTFRIRTQKSDAKFAPGERILSLLTGPDNQSSYTQIGFVKPDGRVILWQKYRTEQYRSLVRVLRNPGQYPTCVYHYEGRCRVCDRSLTTPESISSGIGPVCGGRL